MCVPVCESPALILRNERHRGLIDQGDAQSLPWYAAKAFSKPFIPDEEPIKRDGGFRGV